MGARWLWGVLVLGTACSSAKPAIVEAPATGGSGYAQEESASSRYVDEYLGFELTRPNGDWLLDETGEITPEGLAIPLTFRHRATGAQVVIQVAPALATPTQFAERLTMGLRKQPGFVTTEVRPLPISDNAVGFDFTVGQEVRGRVAVRDGSPRCSLSPDTSGCIFMLLATWPTAAPSEVTESVDALFESVRPLDRP